MCRYWWMGSLPLLSAEVWRPGWQFCSQGRLLPGKVLLAPELPGKVLLASELPAVQPEQEVGQAASGWLES